MPAGQIATMTNSVALVPALIDPPGPYASLEEWRNYREDLWRSDLPGLAPFIRDNQILQMIEPRNAGLYTLTHTSR
jgi:hypothetical protein